MAEPAIPELPLMAAASPVRVLAEVLRLICVASAEAVALFMEMVISPLPLERMTLPLSGELGRLVIPVMPKLATALVPAVPVSAGMATKFKATGLSRLETSLLVMGGTSVPCEVVTESAPPLRFLSESERLSVPSLFSMMLAVTEVACVLMAAASSSSVAMVDETAMVTATDAPV